MRISVAIDALRRADLGTLQIASVGAFALHNCEEIPTLSDWISQTVPSLGHLVTCGTRGILIAATLLTACYALAVFFTYRKSGTIPLVVFATAYSAVFANAIAHVALAAVFWAYVPGLVTSAMLIVPLSVLIYRRIVQERHLTALGLAGVVVTGAAIVYPASYGALSVAGALSRCT